MKEWLARAIMFCTQVIILAACVVGVCAVGFAVWLFNPWALAVGAAVLAWCFAVAWAVDNQDGGA